jgi:hypothetical protein
MASPIPSTNQETPTQYPTFEDEDDGYTSQEGSESDDDSTDAGFEPLEELEDSDSDTDTEDDTPALNLGDRRQYARENEPPEAAPPEAPDPPAAHQEDEDPPELDEDELPDLEIDHADPTTRNFIRNNTVTFARPERIILNPTGNGTAQIYQTTNPNNEYATVD